MMLEEQSTHQQTLFLKIISESKATSALACRNAIDVLSIQGLRPVLQKRCTVEGFLM